MVGLCRIMLKGQYSQAFLQRNGRVTWPIPTLASNDLCGFFRIQALAENRPLPLTDGSRKQAPRSQADVRFQRCLKILAVASK